MNTSENATLELSKIDPLATEPIRKLLRKFAVPSIISLVISALYNIVDQIFIGNGVGTVGNAATNIAFPLSTVCIAFALLIGIGTASNFNLATGRGNRELAGRYAANGITLLIISGLFVTAMTALFLKDLLYLFGATDEIYPFAYEYTVITNIGMPFLIFTTGMSHIIRADDSPRFAMLTMLSGAIINTILDPIFIFVFHWGMFGAALATVIGQIASVIPIIFYCKRFKSCKLKRTMFIPKKEVVLKILLLGMAAAFNQAAITTIIIVSNNVMRIYGSASEYGSEIPLAVVGVVSKVNIIYLSVVIGICQGCQPIIGHNYGAKDYTRVKQTYYLALKIVTVVSILSFLVFQIFPRQITVLFGSGNELYFKFATSYFRIFMVMTWVNGLQPLSATFFTSIGKSWKGIILSLSRHIIFFLPLVLIIPTFIGIDGILYAGPIADFAAACVCAILIIGELRKVTKLSREHTMMNSLEHHSLDCPIPNVHD